MIELHLTPEEYRFLRDRYIEICRICKMHSDYMQGEGTMHQKIQGFQKAMTLHLKATSKSNKVDPDVHADIAVFLNMSSMISKIYDDVFQFDFSSICSKLVIKNAALVTLIMEPVWDRYRTFIMPAIKQ